MRTLLVLIVLWSNAVAAVVAGACPFCNGSPTFSDEIAMMDAVVIADLIEPPPPAKSDDNGKELPKAKFKIVRVVKGDSLVKPNQMIETICFGDAKKGTPFLVMGVDPNNLMWSTPLKLSDRSRNYILQLVGLRKEGRSRLEFFQQYLEDPDEIIARDAYDEFAKAPYAAVQDLKPKMQHEKLVSWIQNPDIPTIHRRLYLTMLGVCGGANDISMLEEMLQSDDRKVRAGLDAMIACYLTLKGPAGMPLIEKLYLNNPKAEYTDTNAAIKAIRFHGSEASIIPKQRLTMGLRYVLDRPQLADLVIPDLARWEDWAVMDKMVQLFKTDDEKNSWVRVPVINYLRACPKAEAKKYIEELEKIDPAAVKRANTFFEFGGAAPVPEKS